MSEPCSGERRFCPNESYHVLLIGESVMCEAERMQCDVVPVDVHLELPGRIKTARTVSFIDEHMVEVGLCESKAPTLLDAGMATNFVFKLDCCTREVMERVNAANVSAGLEKCVNTLNGECDFGFYRVACSTFDRNLRLVDSRFPQVIANALLRYFFGEGTTCLQIVDAMERDDVPGIGEGMYKHLFKKFLCAVALGMTPKEEWSGHDDASSGYVIACNDGEVFVFHAYNRDSLGNYLLSYTKYETASISKYDDGLVYEHDGEYFINLSLQIGFP